LVGYGREIEYIPKTMEDSNAELRGLGQGDPRFRRMLGKCVAMPELCQGLGIFFRDWIGYTFRYSPMT
jgi:hypothetical protein